MCYLNAFIQMDVSCFLWSNTAMATLHPSIMSSRLAFRIVAIELESMQCPQPADLVYVLALQQTDSGCLLQLAAWLTAVASWPRRAIIMQEIRKTFNIETKPNQASPLGYGHGDATPGILWFYCAARLQLADHRAPTGSTCSYYLLYYIYFIIFTVENETS